VFLKNLTVWLLALVCIGCADEFLPMPTAPTHIVQPQFNGTIGFIWGYVLTEPTGQDRCLTDATVEVLDGTKAGAKSVQKVCDFDSGVGYSFRDLIVGEGVTLRASRAGYRSQEQQLVTPSGGPPLNFVLVKE
jgi:hypothetical protein